MSQGTFLNTVTFNEMVNLVEKKYLTISQMAKPAVMELFIKEPIPGGTGESRRFDELDIQTFGRLKREAEKTKKAAVGIGYNVEMKVKRIGMEIDITYEMRNYNKHSQAATLITTLGHFCPQRMELDGTHILTFGNATSYVDMDGETVNTAVGDGLSLINAAHTLRYSTTTYSNRVTGDPVFSAAALELAEQLSVTNILSNFGEKRVMDFNVIVTSQDPNTVNAVRREMESTANLTSPNAGVINVNRGKYRHVVLPYLDSNALGGPDSNKRRWWFLVAVGQGTNGWQAYLGEWEAPHLKAIDTSETGANHDYSADTWTFGTRAGYAFRAVTGRGIIGSLAS